MSETKCFPNGAVQIEDGMPLFSVPAGTEVWFEDLRKEGLHGFRVHLDPAPEDIEPDWTREWPPVKEAK